MSNPAFKCKQYIKMHIQNKTLPAAYAKAVEKYQVDKNLVIMADAHSDELPDSMVDLYSALVEKGYEVKIWCKDIAKLGAAATMDFMKDFMEEYAKAGFVIICSYFLPVSSCVKRPETTVIQLWHSGGLLKKMGYDTAEDIPDYYKGNVTANYDLVTVSAPICEPVWQQAMRLPDGVVKALGLARTDKYFDEARNAGLRDKLFNAIPEAKDKKIALYAPSFTGNASSAENKGIESGIDKAFEGRDDWFFIMKPHPHTIDKYKEYMDERLMDMSTDELYASADLFITDYSSALFDYCVYKKPFLLYCPDRDDYAERRGFYVDPDTFPCKLTTSVEELKEVLDDGSWNSYSDKDYQDFYDTYMSACDGHAIGRIISYMENINGR